jgi:hypothetical protein
MSAWHGFPWQQSQTIKECVDTFSLTCASVASAEAGVATGTRDLFRVRVTVVPLLALPASPEGTGWLEGAE